MLLRLSGRAAPIVLIVVSSVWTAGTILPFVYSLLSPNRDIGHVVEALEGRETLHAELTSFIDQVINSKGRLRRAIQVAAFFGVSAEYRGGQSHVTKTTEVSYLAWFEKRSRPIIFVVIRTEVDESWLRFQTDESSIFSLLRIYVLPGSFLALSVYWFLSKRSPTRPEARLDAGALNVGEKTSSQVQ